MGTKLAQPSEEFTALIESIESGSDCIAAEHAIVGSSQDGKSCVFLVARTATGRPIAITMESSDICRVMAEGILAASRATFGTDQMQEKHDA